MTGVILLNYNNIEDTLACLDSLLQMSEQDFFVLLADNASSENPLEKIRIWAQQQQVSFADLTVAEILSPAKIMFLQNGTNLGFGAGNNQAMKKALLLGAKNLWILNNDTIVAENTLSLLKEELAQSKKALIGSELYYYDSPQQIQAYGGGQIWYSRGSTKNLLQTGIPDYLTGASLFFSIQFLRDVGFFDERFFMYWEDVDLSQRAKKRGYQIKVASGAKVFHKENASSANEQKKDNLFMYQHSLKGCIRFWLKHYPFAWLIPVTSRLLQLSIERIRYFKGKKVLYLHCLCIQSVWYNLFHKKEIY